MTDDEMSGLDSMMASLQRRGPKVPPPKRKAFPTAPTEAMTLEIAAVAPRTPRKVASKPAASRLSGRLMRVQLTVEQDRWLMDVAGDALKDGRRVSETAIVRFAVEQLHGLSWGEIRDRGV